MSGFEGYELPRQRRGVSRWALLAGAGVVTVGVLAWINWPASPTPRRQEQGAEPAVYERPVETTRPPAEPPPPAALTAPVPMPPPPASLQDLAAPQATTFAMPAGPRKERPRMTLYGSAVAAAPAAPAATGPADPGGLPSGAGGDGKPLSVAFKGGTIPGGRAGIIANPALTLMPQIVQCNLINAVDSTVPGPVWCVLENDVLSPDNVVLMEKGTQVFGEFKQGPQQGQDRIMAMSGWARTPNNVIVPLEGPMADGLGRAGIKGDVDNHFWDRFGGAILLSFTQSAFATMTALAQGNNNNNFTVNTGNMQNVASDALRSTINIQPTLSAPQGSTVSIYIRYPIDFSAVYSLRAR